MLPMSGKTFLILVPYRHQNKHEVLMQHLKPVNTLFETFYPFFKPFITKNVFKPF